MQSINSFFSFSKYICRKLVSECVFFKLNRLWGTLLWSRTSFLLVFIHSPLCLPPPPPDHLGVFDLERKHTQWWTAFPWRLCIFISQLDTMSCVLLWSIRGWALGWNGQKDSVRFSSFAGMIESVCEGAECWESCIAVSGLFQTIDR